MNPARGWITDDRITRKRNSIEDRLDAESSSAKHRRKDSFIEKLNEWLRSRDSETLVVRMCLDSESFEAFLSQDHVIVGDEIMSILNALDLAITAQNQGQSLRDVLKVFCKTHFLEKHVLAFLVDKRLKEDSWPEVETVFNCLVRILEEILDKMPTYVNQCLTMASHLTGMMEVFTLLKPNSELKHRFDVLRANSMDKADQINEETKTNTPKFFDAHDSDVPPDDFRTLSVVPTMAELREDVKPFIRPAIVKGVYNDVNHYLDIQFRLMKQDFLHPLRLGINEFIRCGCRKDFWSSDIRIYVHVHIDDMQSKDAIDHVLRFDVSKLRNVKWDVSKRLIFGSLLCLSKDNFQTVIFATVANRDVARLRRGYITVSVKTGLDVVFSSSTSDTFVMVETTAYFESYQHVLKGLQEMSSTLPLQDYIIKCQKDIKPPKYLHHNGVVPMYDVSCLRISGTPTSIPVLSTDKWPPTHEMCLNESQREAAQMALTKEIALIQGPPGTGKTYVGLKVMETLLGNKSVRTGIISQPDPILVVCYTNHALDQFLEGVLNFCNNGIIRVGGKSASEALEKFNLRHVKKKFRRKRLTSQSVRANKAICVQNLKALTQKIKNIRDSINSLDIEILNEDSLKPYIPQNLYDSLCRCPNVSQSRRPNMKQWLNVSDESAEQVIPALIKKRLSNLVINWTYTEYLDLTEKMEIDERASMYMYLVHAYRQILYDELLYLSTFPQDYNNQGKTKYLDDMFRASYVSILPDRLLQLVLQWYFPMGEICHFISTKVLKSQAAEFNDRLIECWVLGLHNSLHRQLNDIQALCDKFPEDKNSTEDGFDDTEASKKRRTLELLMTETTVMMMMKILLVWSKKLTRQRFQRTACRQ